MAPRVLVTRRIPDAGLKLVLDATDADLWEDELPPPRDELLRRVAGVEGLLSLLTDRVDDELLDAAGGQLKVISNFAVGFDNIDVPACTRRGIPVGNTPGVLTETTADLAFALLMAVARRLTEGYDHVRQDRWKTWGPMLLLGRDIHGATLGIVGFGRIGREMAKRASGFGMRVLYHDVHRASPDDEAALNAESVEMDRLLAESDFVSLHTNLTPETEHLLDADAFGRMKRGAIVINTSRGPVIDPDALERALASGQIGGAGLDVTDPEPMRADHPLLHHPNCLVVPHIASASVATRDRMAEMAAGNLLSGLRGERLPTPVNPEVYDQPNPA
ncbi:MAG: D-glycerate dehydrogenase [Chloroflexi bacterium]|nr:D-glycerate dehydrogenase [Chloroflexota bacterium]